MLESGPTHSLIAKLSQHLLLVVCEFHSAGEQRSEQGYRQECANFDAMAPETHQNHYSYVGEFSIPTFNSLRKNLAWWVVTRRT